ncbi:tyrosine-type recombinase/integrase [Variovorax sp. MHTC-1]|uniref:tyrosine-type recombinase/integrase n=1 Tax=Variovorax sp. MHTC-1 TaxID=2495593 RepID=UPI000F89741A|nr:hypothetical protein [Variovorax sp. MHTC-1]RST51854.1 hypothetical protein EJI01_18235 [Variovorax sp. MHTC-1]
MRRNVEFSIANGIDPIQHREQQKIAKIAAAIELQQASMTFEDCAREFHKERAAEWKNLKHRAQWINTLVAYVFPLFGKTSLKEIGKREILTTLTPLWKTKAETADRLLQRIRKVMNYGAAKDYCQGVDSEFWEQIRIALGSNEKARKVQHHPSCPHSQVGGRGFGAACHTPPPSKRS